MVYPDITRLFEREGIADLSGTMSKSFGFGWLCGRPLEIKRGETCFPKARVHAHCGHYPRVFDREQKADMLLPLQSESWQTL